MKDYVNDSVRNGLINQIKSTCASDIRMLSGFLTQSEVETFISEVISKTYTESNS